MTIHSIPIIDKSSKLMWSIYWSLFLTLLFLYLKGGGKLNIKEETTINSIILLIVVHQKLDVMKIHTYTASKTVYSDICYNSDKRAETDIRKYIFAISKLPTSGMCYLLISKKQQHLTLSRTSTLC